MSRLGKLPPLCVLLLHLGACGEAVEWAGRRDCSANSLANCVRDDWREWIFKALRVHSAATWPEIHGAAVAALSGNGSGSGNGNGSGNGYGDGSGNGYGYGSGDGYGYGSGDGNGYGDGSGDGSGRSDIVT